MSERRFRWWLLVLTAGGAMWRLGYLFAVKIDDALALNDSLYYSIQAGRNSEGAWFREALSELPGAEHGPLTSLYLTPWSLGGGDNVRWQRFATTLLGIATVAVIGLLGRRLAGPLVGLVAAAIAVVYPNLWINDSLIMSESLACLIVAGALIVAVDFDRRPRLALAVALGALVGLGALTRSEIALYAFGFGALAWWRAAAHPRRALMPVAIVVTAIVVIAPWTVYNVGRFERPVVLSTNDGTTLLGANCDSTYFDDIGGWDIRCLAAAAVDETVDASRRSVVRRDVAVDYAAEHLARLPVVAMARVGRLLDVYGLGSLVALDAGEEKAPWAVWAGIVCWWLLALSAIGGWRALRDPAAGRADDDPSPSTDPRARWWLVVPLGAVLITSVLFYGAHRVRAPAEPVVVVLAAAGLVALATGRRREDAGPGTGGVRVGDAETRRRLWSADP